MPFLPPPALRLARATVVGLVVAAAAACGNDPTGPTSRDDNKHVVGELLQLNVNTDDPCDAPRRRTGRVVAVGQHAVVVADTGNPAGGFTDAEYQSFAAGFDTLAYQVGVQYFGEPTDIDENEGVIIFFTRAVNELTPAGADYVIGGFFWERDLFPKAENREYAGCPGSNEAEMFYMLVPDPQGAVNNNVRTKLNVSRGTVATLGHEFQHLINSSRRLYVTQTEDFAEETWLNEGLSHVAEELMFFRAAGLTPRQNLDLPTLVNTTRVRNALNTYNLQNLDRLTSQLRNPEGNSPYAKNDSLATRGATWAFLRYAADRQAGSEVELFQRLVNSPETGLANLRAALGAGVDDWFRDWAVALVADDRGAGVPPQYTFSSWNFRSVLSHEIFAEAQRYPLRVRPLGDGQPQAVTLVAGGTTYLSFAVPAGGQAVVQARATGGSALPATVRLGLVDLTTGAVTEPAAGDLTVGASAGTTGYALVAFNAAESGQAEVTVTATGIIPAAVASRAPNAAMAGPTLARLAQDAAPVLTDAPLRERLSVLTRRELVPRAAAAREVFEARQAGHRRRHEQ